MWHRGCLPGLLEDSSRLSVGVDRAPTVGREAGANVLCHTSQRDGSFHSPPDGGENHHRPRTKCEWRLGPRCAGERERLLECALRLQASSASQRPGMGTSEPRVRAREVAGLLRISSLKLSPIVLSCL